MSKSVINEEQVELFINNATEETASVIMQRGVKNFLSGLGRKLGELTDDVIEKAAADVQAFNLRKTGAKKSKDVVSVQDKNIITRWIFEKAAAGAIPQEAVFTEYEAKLNLIKQEIEQGGISETYNVIREDMGLKALEPVAPEEIV